MTSEWSKAWLQAAITVHGEPEIVNMDQGSQFTSHIFIERFWRNFKYEKIYLEPSEDGLELYAKVKWYMEFYNVRRPHQSLGYQRPEKKINLTLNNRCLTKGSI